MSACQMYKLVAVPFLLAEGEFKGHLETVTFIAASESGETHRWWSVNDGKLESDFQTIVSPELAKDTVERLRAGKTVEFPNRYELQQVKDKFGGSGRD